MVAMQSQPQTATRPGLAGWRQNPLSSVALSLVTLAIVCYFVVVPLATILISSLKPAGLPDTRGWTLDHLRYVFLSADTYLLLATHSPSPSGR